MCAVSQVASRPAPGVTTENSPVATLRGGIALGLGIGLGVNPDEGDEQAPAPNPTNASPTLPERTRMSMTHNRSWARADQPLPIGADRRLPRCQSVSTASRSTALAWPRVPQSTLVELAEATGASIAE
jgi:hypothetical protein